MPRMNFSTVYTRVESITNVKSQRDLIKDAIQWGLDEITSKNMEYLTQESFFTTIAPYEDGTVDATNGSKNVSGTGTTFTAAMAGRKIRINDQEAYYRIDAFVNTTEITLEAPYQNDDVTDKSFSIYKDEYKLAPDVDVYKILRNIEENISMISGEISGFDLFHPSPKGEGTPRFELFIGTELDEDTTGTVAGTVGLSVLAGTNTSWTTVEGLNRGTRLTVGTNTYTVKSVDNDTQITIYELLVLTVSSQSYTAHLDNPTVLISDIPNTAQNIYYRYQRIPFPLIGDTDIPDLPEKYHRLLITYGCAWAWLTKDKEESFRQFSIFNSGKEKAWARLSNTSTSRIFRRRSMDDRGFNFRGPPRPPSNYGFPLEI